MYIKHNMWPIFVVLYAGRQFLFHVNLSWDVSNNTSFIVHFFNWMYYFRCAKELNQWELVLEYGQSAAAMNPLLVLESCWHIPNWSVMKEVLAHVEQSYPREMSWKVRRK